MADSLLYLRTCSVVLGPKSADQVLISGLKICFSITKSLEPQPNIATLDVYNLSDESLAIIGAKHSTAVVNAGYGANLRNIFTGGIAKFTTKWQGPTRVTCLEMADGASSYGHSRLDKSFSPGVLFGQVLDQVLAASGLGQEQVKGVNRNDQFHNGLSITGLVRDHLNMLVKRQGLQWSIQDEKIQILPSDTPTDGGEVLLNNETGLIGQPFRSKILNMSLLKKQTGHIYEDGVQVVSLLNPEIKCGRLVTLKSESVNGRFKVIKLKHTGDTHGTPWYTEVEMIPVKK